MLDKNSLFSAENQTINQLNLMILCLVAVLAAVALLMLFYMLKPLYQIERYMRKIQQGQLEVRFEHITRDEFGQIKAGFNRMMDHITKLLTDIEKKEEEKREIAVQTLRAQITPHFLYNTLNIIRWKAVLAGNNTVGDMIVTLIRAMEFNGNRKEEFVTIRDEIDNVRNYIRLLEYHYEGQFEVVWELDEMAMECYICKLLLQPLVENAVFHGIIPKKEKGIIRIGVKREKEEIVFEVADNGVGMTEEQEEKICQGIGFSNVNGRLQYYFGKEHGIILHNVRGKGVALRFSIPVIEALPYDRAVLRGKEDGLC